MGKKSNSSGMSLSKVLDYVKWGAILYILFFVVDIVKYFKMLSAGDQSVANEKAKKEGVNKSNLSFSESELEDKANLIYQAMAPWGETDFDLIVNTLAGLNVDDLNYINIAFGVKDEYAPHLGIVPNLGWSTGKGTLSQWFSGTEFTDSEKEILRQIVNGSKIQVN